MLVKPTKWMVDKGQPLKTDDIVLIVDEHFPRRCWKLGKILHAIKGSDGLVRVVHIKTMAGIIRRPVSKICRF